MNWTALVIFFGLAIPFGIRAIRAFAAKKTAAASFYTCATLTFVYLGGCGGLQRDLIAENVESVECWLGIVSTLFFTSYAAWETFRRVSSDKFFQGPAEDERAAFARKATGVFAAILVFICAAPLFFIAYLFVVAFFFSIFHYW